MKAWVVSYYILFSPATDYLINRNRAIAFSTEDLARSFAAKPTLPDRIDRVTVKEEEVPADSKIWARVPSAWDFL